MFTPQSSLKVGFETYSTRSFQHSIGVLIHLALENAGGDPSGWYIPPWTLEADKNLSKSVGNKTAILSVTAPGACIEKDSSAAAQLARECNEYSAALRDQEPNAYGFFASLPSILDTAASLTELAYAFDELHADGVTLFTRYGPDNHYLGHEDFAPIWAELNRRKAVVFIHPTHPVDTHLVNSALPQPMFDYPHETGRTAMDLIVNDTLRSAPDCKIILSHAGGTLPWLIYRAAEMLPLTPMTIGKSTEEIIEEAQQFYLDTAISSHPVTLKALLEFAKPGHVLFGTDFPNAPTAGIEYFTRKLETFELDPEVREGIYSGTALGLFPRLRALHKG